MRGAVTLFIYREIPVRVHWSFLMVFVVLAVEISQRQLSLTAAWWLIFFFLWVFVFVILHEFGHALVARKYGIQTHDIVLLPIGGVARLVRSPVRPVEELVIAFAGPAVNLIIAIILGLILLVTKYSWPGIDPTHYYLQGRMFLPALVLLNLTLFLFNLIPALPMDGGRVLRSALSFFMSRLQATFWSMWLGKLIGLGLAGFGMYFQEWLVMLIGLFVFYHSGKEYRQVKRETLWMQTPLSAMINNTDTGQFTQDKLQEGEWLSLDASASAFQAWELLLDHPDAQILVVHQQTPLGVLTKEQFSAKF